MPTYNMQLGDVILLKLERLGCTRLYSMMESDIIWQPFILIMLRLGECNILIFSQYNIDQKIKCLQSDIVLCSKQY